MLTKQLIAADLRHCVNDRLNNILIIVVGSVIGMIEIYVIEAYSFSEMFNILLLSILITFLCWHGNQLINKWHLEYMPWDENPPVKILHLFLFNGIYTSIVIVLALLAFNKIILLIPDATLGIAMRWGVGVGMTVGLITNTIFVGVYFFDEWKASLVEAERLKRENVQSQLNSLRSQVNPHFLFNSLNTLTALITEDQEKAVNFVRDFSDLYRYILKAQDQEISTLEEELYAANVYLQLQKERFEEKLSVNIDLPKERMNMHLPTLTLQMLVENCIKHNIVSQSKPLNIRIFIEKDTLVVQNNLQKKQTMPPSTGLGLKNITKRYDFLSHQKVVVKESKDFFKVYIPLLKMN